MMLLATLSLATMLADAPTTARYTASVSLEAARKHDIAAAFVSIIGPMPDIDRFVDAGVDVAADFDHVALATDDLRSVSRSCVVIDYGVSRDQMKAHIEAALATSGADIEWMDHDGVLAGQAKQADGSIADPRWYVLPAEPFLALVPAGHHEAFLGAGDAKAKAFEKRVRAARRGKHLFALEVHDLDAALTNPSTLLLPKHLDVTLDVNESAKLRAKLAFATATDAVELETIWDTTIRDAIERNIAAKLMLGALYDASTLRRKRATVSLETPMTNEQLAMILDLLGKMTEKERARAEARARQRAQPATTTP